MCQPNSKTENLQSTGDVPLDTFHVICLHLNTDFRKKLLLFWQRSQKTTDRITSIQSSLQSPRFLSHVHYQRCCIPYLSQFFSLITQLREFFCASFEKTFIIFISSSFWKIARWKNFFPVSMKVLLKAGKIDKSCPGYDLHDFCFPVMSQDGGRKSPICFFLKLCWNCKLRYNGSGNRRKSFQITRAASPKPTFS